ncbi:MAG: RNA polymerase sigma factor [Patescibacteria group bacterium]
MVNLKLKKAMTMSDKDLKSKHKALDHKLDGIKMKELSDNELIKLLECKDFRVHNELVKRYQRRLFVYIYRFIGNKEEAEDLVQNVFFKVYKYCKNFDIDRKFSSWIYRIAHNEAVNHMKRKSIKKFISLEDFVSEKDRIETKSEAKSPMEAWMSKELRKEMEAALKKIPGKYREVLEMRYFAEKSYEEISKIIKKPVNTVGTLISRAKKKLESVVRASRKSRSKKRAS